MAAVLPPTHAHAAAGLKPPDRLVPGGAAARLVLVITLLLVFLMAARTPLDSDMWWHLSSGEEMLRSGQLLRTEIFSFTRAGAPWTNIYWLADLGMATLFRSGGYLAVSAAVAVLAVASIALVWAQCEGPAFLKAAAVLLASVVSSVVWSPRPQILSLVLLAAVGAILYLYRRGVDRLWILPPLFVLWTNMHGGYPLGLLLIGSVLAGEVLNHLLAVPAGAMVWRKIFRLAVWGAICGFAVLLNPFGLDAWRLPFLTVNMQVLQQFIPEWASPDFHQPLQLMMLVLFFAAVGAAALSGRLMDGADLISLLLFGGMAFVARRNFGPFALVAAPLVARYGADAIHGWQERASWLAKMGGKSPARDHETASQRRVKKVVNLLIVALLAFAAFAKLYIVSHPALVGHYLEQGYPVAATQWIRENSREGNILNEYEWGGWMQREMPGFPVFVDGRTDIFNDEIVGDWITLVQAGPGWQETLARYPVDFILLKPGRPLLKELDATGWQELYHDERAAVYGRK